MIFKDDIKDDTIYFINFYQHVTTQQSKVAA